MVKKFGLENRYQDQFKDSKVQNITVLGPPGREKRMQDKSICQ